jgi:hypothetical protein
MAPNTSRMMIAALQVSLDGFTQGPNGEKDWVDSWADAIELIPDVDTFILGGHMYPGYGDYWKGQALFGGVKKRLSLDLVQAKSTQTGRVIMTYRTRGEEQ